MEDLENGTIPVAVRLDPRFYVGKKAAGYTFLGFGSIELLRECMEKGLVEARRDARLIPRSYFSVWAAIHRASRRAGLDPKIQTCHGFRKYFENALDDASIDHEKKMIIEGHLAGTRARHYTDRDIEQLREIYIRSYPFIELGPTVTTNNVEKAEWHNRLAQIESQVARQKLLEAKITVLEDELDQMRQFRKKLER
jgi:hypothetical protein